MPTVSVIIPTYNCAVYLENCIQSVLKQTFLDYEIIVVDDGSKDNTANVLKKFGDKITCISQTNQGISSARNNGIQLSSGKYIAILDADDEWLPDKLRRQVYCMEQSKAIGAVSCNSYLMNEIGQIMDVTKRKAYQNRKDIAKDLLICNVFSGGTSALIKKECFLNVGLFDEKLKSSEDWDMWLRICKRYEMVILSDPLDKIRVRGNSVSSAANAEKLLANARIVIEKHYAYRRSVIDWFQKRTVYSDRFFCTAWALFQSGLSQKASTYLLKSFVMNPFYFLSRSKIIGFAIKLILGNKIFSILKIKKERMT